MSKRGAQGYRKVVDDAVGRIAGAVPVLAPVALVAVAGRALLRSVRQRAPRNPSQAEDKSLKAPETSGVIDTGPAAIDSALSELKQSTRGAGISSRRAARELRRLISLIDDNTDDFAAALASDLGTRAVDAELALLLARNTCTHALSRMKHWNAPEFGYKEELVTFPSRKWVQYDPIGVVLVASAYNAPIILSLRPLVQALCARNAVIVKPSIDGSPAFARTLQNLLPQYLDSRIVKVVSTSHGGDADALTALIDGPRFRNLVPDKLLFIGSPAVGRIVYAQAARRLMSVTLELGGQDNTLIVAADADVPAAARQAVLVRYSIGGQICLGNNKHLIDRRVFDKFLGEVKKAIELILDDGWKGMNKLQPRHFERARSLLRQTTGKVVFGGNVDESNFLMQATVVIVEREDDVLLKHEIWAPIMAVMSIESADDAIDKLAAQDAHPLVSCIFTETPRLMNKACTHIKGGTCAINGCVSFRAFGCCL